MSHPKVLSEVHGLGRISRCSGCPDLHVRIGPVDLRVPAEALDGLAAMMIQAQDEVRLEAVRISAAQDIQMASSSYHWNLC